MPEISDGALGGPAREPGVHTRLDSRVSIRTGLVFSWGERAESRKAEKVKRTVNRPGLSTLKTARKSMSAKSKNTEAHLVSNLQRLSRVSDYNLYVPDVSPSQPQAIIGNERFCSSWSLSRHCSSLTSIYTIVAPPTPAACSIRGRGWGARAAFGRPGGFAGVKRVMQLFLDSPL